MKIAIVNDLALARETLRRVLTSSGHELAWSASDGGEAAELARRNLPDLVLMDLIMPGVDGVEGTRRIMAQSPCPILIVTSSVTGNIGMVYEAMGSGALDAIDTPAGAVDPASPGARSLLDKIDRIERMTRGARPAGATTDISGETFVWGVNAKPTVGKMVVIGASTGGPKAIVGLIRQLPRDFNLPIVVVQHVDPAFTSGFITWLASQSPLPVEMAEAGAEPRAGRIAISRTDQHLVLGLDRSFRYTGTSVESFYRPSVDAFFLSVSENWGGPGLGVLLTGMGRDGAVGLKALRKQGWTTFAQDRPSSAVWGMPKAAIEINAANRVLPPEQIGQALAAAGR